MKSPTNALSVLTDYLSESDTTQAEFAKAAGIDPSLFSQIKAGDVAISGKNLGKLLRGIREEPVRLDFLKAYLNEQIPDDYQTAITVSLVNAPSGRWSIAEESSEPSLAEQMAHAFEALPSDLLRRRAIHLLTCLRNDTDLRDLFNRTVAYLEEPSSLSANRGPAPLEMSEGEKQHRKKRK